MEMVTCMRTIRPGLEKWKEYTRNERNPVTKRIEILRKKKEVDYI